MRGKGAEDKQGAGECVEIVCGVQSMCGTSLANAESPHAAARPMMARVRKPIARCAAGRTVVFSVSVSFFCLAVVFLVFWVLTWVSVCPILTWNVPNLLCRAKTAWSYRTGRSRR